MEIKEQIRQFITKNFYIPDPSVVRDDASLLIEGIIDSTGVLELVRYLEESFGIKVEDAELLPENLDSLNQIEAFIQRKRKGK